MGPVKFEAAPPIETVPLVLITIGTLPNKPPLYVAELPLGGEKMMRARVDGDVAGEIGHAGKRQRCRCRI